MQSPLALLASQLPDRKVTGVYQRFPDGVYVWSVSGSRKGNHQLGLARSRRTGGVGVPNRRPSLAVRWPLRSNPYRERLLGTRDVPL
jgi:hypothetical protein